MASSIDDDALAELDLTLLQDSRWKRETAEILRLQKELRALVSSEVWQIYLLLEAACNRRLARGLEVAATRGRG